VTLRQQFREGTRAVREFMAAAEAALDMADDLAARQLRVVSPAVPPGTGGGGGATAPPASTPDNFGARTGLTGTSGTASTGTRGGGTGPGSEVDPWVRSYAPDNSFTARLSDVRKGEPTTVGLLGGRTVAGWIFAEYVFIDPEGVSNVGATTSGAGAGGGPRTGPGTWTRTPRITGGPDGGAQTGTRRTLTSSVDPGAAATDRMRRELGGKLDRLSSQLQGGGMADAIRRAR
jgi:hypothetical protein